MIFEFLFSVAELPFARNGWRPVAEQAAIRARLRRHAPLWGTHLAICRDLISETARRCQGNGTAVVLGSGLLLDIPIECLCRRFERVLLVDLHHPFPARLAKRRLGNIEFRHADVTQEDFWSGLEAGVDYVVSANLAGQLSLQSDDASPAAEHIRRLASSSGVRLLISERFRLELDEQGRELAVESALPALPQLGQPERTWKWYLAPPGELAPYRGLALEVGAWVWSD